MLIFITACSCHVTYAFQSETKELLARSRRNIWSLSDCNWTRAQNHLVRERTLNHLAKLALGQLVNTSFLFDIRYY